MGNLNLVGPTSDGPHIKIGSQRTINWFPVKPEREGDAWYLRGTPGIDQIGTLERDEQRGWHIHKGRLFIVAGARVYEVYSDGTSRDWGTISTVRGRVVMASLLNVIVMGDGSRFYALDLDAATVAPITDAPRGLFCVFFNQRILFQGENGQVFYSELNDPTNIPGLNFFTAEALPDEIVAITTTEDRIGLHGDDSTEWWFDSGDADNPFQRIPGGVAYIGCAHPHTALRLDNAVWMVGRDKEGAHIVWRSQGTTFTRVSTSAVERFLADSETVTAYSYQEEGHAFYVLNSEVGTRAFDILTGEWHERAWLNPATGHQDRQRQEFCAYVFGSHHAGDWETGDIYRMGLDLYDDAALEIRRTRVSPHVRTDGKPLIIHELFLDFATGVGLDGEGQGVDPKVMLRVAKDGAAYGDEQTTSLGKIGSYRTQARFHRLGVGRDWLFEVSVSDPVFVALKGADIRAVSGRR